MKLVLIVMNSYYKISKVVVTLPGTASRLCLISEMKSEFFCSTGLRPSMKLYERKEACHFLLILTEAFEKLNYFTLSLQRCHSNNVIFSNEEDLPRKPVWVVWSCEWELLRVPKLCSVGRQKWGALWRRKVKEWRI